MCGKPYIAVQDYKQDLNDLVATCQRHTRCSTNYCLRTIQGQQLCRFGYPKQLQPETVINNDDDQPELLTARNDPLLNSYNPNSIICMESKRRYEVHCISTESY